MPLIDERDSEIIEALRRDCRASNAEIARRVDVSEGTVRRRLNRLLDERIIEISVIDRARQAEVDDEKDAPRQRVEVRMTVLPKNLDEALAATRELVDKDAAIVSGPYDITARTKAEDRDEMSRLQQVVRGIEGVEKFEIQPILNDADYAKPRK